MNMLSKLFLNEESSHEQRELRDKLNAVSRSQAIIEFDHRGNILEANDNFLQVMGYRRDEVVGQHHSIFVDPAEKNSTEYQQFWASLNRGDHFVKEFRRIGAMGKEVWIHGSYNPLLDADGNVYKVIKFATDITQQKSEANENIARMEAISKSQAVIEFNMDGSIIWANDNFLDAMGYRLDEVQGQHHSIFVHEKDRHSQDYRDFWAKLNRGEYESQEYRRIGKNGKDVWIQASYNPVVGLDGKPFKVIKFATDITEQKKRAEENKKNANISNALMLCQANVMLADNELNITYINHQVKRMLKNREAEIQRGLPDFQVDKLIGQNVDVFHKQPAHQRRVLSKLNKAYQADINIESLTFGLVATPWYNTEGERIGTVVEWEDKTERLAREGKAQREAEENARVKQALDNVTANVMIADEIGRAHV